MWRIGWKSILWKKNPQELIVKKVCQTLNLCGRRFSNDDQTECASRCQKVNTIKIGGASIYIEKLIFAVHFKLYVLDKENRNKEKYKQFPF